ncbi:hypothetical protein H0H87_008999 [Tephrocybe sp. NHM501043]|nr:hypothetical protein H0H87_008999 [Tephrocybe sp. NHM501043]
MVNLAEFGLPNFRSLSPADQSHIWLATLDIVALAIFVWQAVYEAIGVSSDFASASDPASSVRMWFVMTVRQTCLLIATSITLLHVRMGRPVSFGAKHWMLWAPTVLLTVTSTAIAGVMAGAGLDTLFIGLISYSSMVAILSSVAFTCLVITLVIIKRNLSSLNDRYEPWPPVRMEEKPRKSFATEDVDAIRDGASWITSNTSSHRGSISQWSFSTHHTAAVSSYYDHSGHAPKCSYTSVPPKSSFWFNVSTINVNDIPPVPPLPGTSNSIPKTINSLNDPDPFRRDTSSPHPRARLESQTSWLTSTDGSHSTMSAWSYPTSVQDGNIHNANSPDLHTALTPVSRPVAPKLANAKVLGGYGFAPGSLQAEKGLAASPAPPGTTIGISMIRLLGWLLYIWVPHKNLTSSALLILFVLSVTMSSPLLALTILFRSPIPIPSGLFDTRAEHSQNDMRAPSPTGTNAPLKWSHDYKRSTSTSPTVVEGCRSGDIWLTNGNAVDGKSKIGRLVGMLSPMPKLSAMPPKELEDGEYTPPLPIQDEDSSLPVNMHNRSHSESSTQFSRIRMDSQASSHLSGTRESLLYASKIMIAERHYSALAKTVVLSPSTEKNQVLTTDEVLGSASGATTANGIRQSTHLRTRSVSSISVPVTPTRTVYTPSPPPTCPLPPTPPIVKAARLATMAHKRSFSSGSSFGKLDNLNEIDALTAGVLPILVPGINTTCGMKVKNNEWSPGAFSKTDAREFVKKLNEFEDDFSSPQVHSTPARYCAYEPRPKKTSTHKRNHLSLPSLGLGKDDIHSLSNWSAEVRGTVEKRTGQHYMAVPARNMEIDRRNTVFGAETVPNIISHLHTVHEDAAPSATREVGLHRTVSTRSLGFRVDVPHGLNTLRDSLSDMAPPFSAASTVALFEEFVAGLDLEPQAQSTPHQSVFGKPKSKHVTPPLLLTKSKCRSSTVYVKSVDVSPTNLNPIAKSTTTPPSSAISAFTQWSTRMVRPLIPKTSNLQSKISNADSSLPSTKSGSLRGNLRPLKLLQERNSGNNPASPVLNATRPLTLAKRQKASGAAPAQDDNAYPDISNSGSRNLKPLKLARSSTSKIRGV